MEIGVVVYVPSWFIFAVILVDYFVFSALQKTMYRWLRDDYRWLRRESELLNGLVRDHQRLEKSVKEINRKANQVWDLMPGAAGITLQLDETQRRWLVTATTVAKEAKEAVERHEDRVSRGYFHRWRELALVNLILTIQQSRGMKKARKEMSDHLADENISLRKVCESLEQSSRNVRCLKDRPIDEAWSAQPVNQEPDLVHAFVEDLRGLQLESKMEKAWVKEARRIVDERQTARETFLREEADQNTRWLSVLGMWRARRRVAAEIELADSLLSDLLDAKKKYGFKFVGRESSKFSQPNSVLASDGDAVVSSAAGRIGPLLEKERRMMSTLVYNEVTVLCSQLEETQKILKKMVEASNEGARKTRTASFEQLTRISGRAVNCVVRFIEMGPYPWISLAFPYLSPAHRTFLSQIRDLQKAASFLQKSIRGHRIEMVEDSSSVVGFEEDVHALVSKLMMPCDTANPSIVCIVGMKGIGKTTLVKEICNHTSIVNHFKERRRFLVPQDNNGVSLVVGGVTECLETWTKCPDGKPYLLVLDNLLSMEAWDKLKPGVTDATTKGLIRTVITMRDKKVASHVEPGTIHRLRLRTKEESLKLFTQMIPMSCEIVQTQQISEEEQETPERKKEALLRKIVRRAGGLPLTILHIGHLLAGKKLEDVTLEVLSRVLEHVTQGHNQKPWLDMWEINKDDMWEINEADIKSPSILGKCLSSFEIIPFNFEIPARRLVALWVARGLVDGETSENVAYGHLSELINRNMIQVVESRLNGKVKTCRFPAALRELWLQRPRDSGAIRAWSLTTSQDGQLAYHFDDTDANHKNRIHGLGATLPNFLHQVRYPRAIMFFDTREGKKPGHDIGNFLHKGIKSGRFHDLLVLDLEGIFRPHLPKNIGDLKKLTYLGLRWTYLEKIPSSIGKLSDLQSLDMKYTCIRKLPESVWQLGKLRHLYLNEHRIILMPRPISVPLKNLRTLSGAFLDEHSPLKDSLENLSDLHKLDLVFQLSIHQQRKLAESILKLTKLRSLSLSSVDVKSQPRDLKLEALSGLENLSVLYLFGKLKAAFDMKDKLPNSLTELMLSATEIQQDPMGVLGQLPNLKSLSFFSNSYKGEDMACSPNSFPKLLDLKLWSLSSIKRLSVGEGAMKNLREMEIRSCARLEESIGLTHLKTLQELKLTKMPAAYEEYVKNQFASAINRTDQKIHSPKIIVEQ